MDLSNRNALIASMVPLGVCVEVGVAEGYFSDVIIKHNPKHLYLIDPWVVRHRGSYTKDPANFTNHKANYAGVLKRFGDLPNVTIIRKPSGPASKLIADASCHMVYIDANHNRKFVARHMVQWWPKIEPGGYLCGHDWLNEDQDRRWPWIQVRDSVKKFAEEHSLEILLTTDDLPLRTWIIQKPL